MAQIEQDCGEQQRERNRDGNDQRAAHISKKQEQDQRDQQHPVRQVAQNGVSGVVNQVAAVQVRNNLHACGKQPLFSSAIFR